MFAPLGVALSAAFAQSPPGGGFDAHGFRLAAHDADARDPLVVARPGAFEQHGWFASGLLEYASQPLVFATPAGDVVHVEDLVAANLSFGYAPHDRVRLDLAAPVFFHAEGVDRTLGAGLGDLRATGMVVLVKPTDDDGVGLGMVFDVDLPTGRPDAWQGQWSVAGGIGMAATWEGERTTLSGTASTQVRPNTQADERPAPTRGGDAFVWGAAVGYLVTADTGLTLEVHSEAAVDEVVRRALGVPVEALLSMRQLRDAGGFLTLGVGAGLSRGAGASPLRVVVGGGFGDLVPYEDSDADGFTDDVDACPTSAETPNGYHDDDGCPDDRPLLVFRSVSVTGEMVTDAEIVATGPEIYQEEGAAPGVARGSGALILQGPGVDPGTTWSAVATVGSCLEGRAEVTMSDAGDAVDIPIAVKRTGRVRVEATTRRRRTGAGSQGPTPRRGARVCARTRRDARRRPRSTWTRDLAGTSRSCRRPGSPSTASRSRWRPTSRTCSAWCSSRRESASKLKTS